MAEMKTPLQRGHHRQPAARRRHRSVRARHGHRQHHALVLRSGETNRQMAEAKIALLDRLPIRVLGAVINDIRPGELYQYYSYVYGYVSDEEAGPQAGAGAEGRDGCGDEHGTTSETSRPDRDEGPVGDPALLLIGSSGSSLRTAIQSEACSKARIRSPWPVLLQVVQRGGGAQQQLERIHRRLGEVRHRAVAGLDANRLSDRPARRSRLERGADPVRQPERAVGPAPGATTPYSSGPGGRPRPTRGSCGGASRRPTRTAGACSSSGESWFRALALVGAEDDAGERLVPAGSVASELPGPAWRVRGVLYRPVPRRAGSRPAAARSRAGR